MYNNNVSCSGSVVSYWGLLGFAFSELEMTMPSCRLHQCSHMVPLHRAPSIGEIEKYFTIAGAVYLCPQPRDYMDPIGSIFAHSQIRRLRLDYMSSRRGATVRATRPGHALGSPEGPVPARATVLSCLSPATRVSPPLLQPA